MKDDSDLASGKIDGIRHNGGRRKLAWLDSWGAQVNLNLTIVEKSTLNANVGFPTNFKNKTKLYGDGDKIVASQSRSLGVGITTSSEATRTDKIYSFWSIKKLLADSLDCGRPKEVPGFSLLNGELGIDQWVANSVFIKNAGDAGYPAKLGPPLNQNVISYETKFDVLTLGNITPGWKLVDLALNQGAGSFLEGKRERTHDLTITLGPTSDTGKGLALTPLVFAASADIGTSVGTAFRSVLGQ